MAREIPKQANVSYQFQRRKCGRPDCAGCIDKGIGHGPYWYAYWRDGEKVVSAYVGKVKPAHVQVGLQFAKDA